MKLVILESPYAPTLQHTTAQNVEYAQHCVADCLERNEAPFVSHLLYTQPNILDDLIDHERNQGIEAGHFWINAAQAMVVYCDHGLSSGMLQGLHIAIQQKLPIEFRYLAK